MITRIELNGVSSFKKPATLETDKVVNLVYGLNGTGKSTLSNYLYDRSDPEFSGCSISGISDEDILVYNQKFIQDYFFESDNLQGVFTLAKENKEAEKVIVSAGKVLDGLEAEKKVQSEKLTIIKDNLADKKLSAMETTWEIKRTYTGGDRVLEFCLDRLKGNRESLYNHIASLTKPSQLPDETVGDLKSQVESLEGAGAQEYEPIPSMSFSGHTIENEDLFPTVIIGNENSSVSGLIKELDNADWVRKGLEYLPDVMAQDSGPCPFCQEKTLTKIRITSIKDYFVGAYERDVSHLKKCLLDYETAISAMPPKNEYLSNPFVLDAKEEFEGKYSAVANLVDRNKQRAKDKISSPSQMVHLEDSSQVINTLNQFIADVNRKINEHNTRIKNRKTFLQTVTTRFWNIMRYDYDQTIAAYQKEESDAHKRMLIINKEIDDITERITMQRNLIAEAQKTTVNIETAIGSINSGLKDLGIDDFRIEKHSDNLYKVVRQKEDAHTFHTLSEGEKMIISFLYFVEYCKGKKSASAVGRNKIVIIDDPISSLSHIFVFNVGQLIKDVFLRSGKYKQVFILTHSLYFFYELTDTKHERRERDQGLFRMIKNSDGSQIATMKYEEIQSDYHSYWQMIKDEKQPPALIANCMRNIIEYFFSFIEKRDFNALFNDPELKDNKFQAFRRYVDRESHSVGQNIFDYKEFDYDVFREAFRLIFEKNGYPDHYIAMMK